ncbi:DMT family transporter [Georgenia sp. 311]|uniref:DMT family transporter n=1 Tax=Georgenia wutianyii TaxID=2585135 RepID=A0ABX5VRE7_9MICO|nr:MULTISPECIES: DMT family transporter [Georgenia]QDB80421.1 DMT family transporter [Georgenia wutianyii]TNC21380.1 DMT family transporter [Georgenia sp. 311]
MAVSQDVLVPTTAQASAVRAVPRMRHRAGVLAILASATAMGLAGVFGRLSSPPGAVVGEALTLGRMAVGAVGMLAFLAAGRRLGVLRRTRLSWSVVLGGVFLGLSLATYLSAAVLTDLGRAVALHYLGPLVATVLARVLLKERTTGAELVSVLVSAAGMVLAAGLLETGPPAGDALRGDVLAVLSGVLYGAALLTYRYRSDMPSDVRSFWNFAFGALATAGMVALTRPDLSGMTAQHWAWAAGFFLVCGLLALGLLVVAGKNLRAVELSALSYWEVVVALLLGTVLFGEAVSPLGWAGAVLIGIGAALAVGAGHRRSIRTIS